jgi:hypothetical protein
LALRDISRHRINSVAFGAKRTFDEPQSAGPIYEYAPAVLAVTKAPSFKDGVLN